MKICEWCRESYGLGGPEKHEVNECRAILKAKLDATLLQIGELIGMLRRIHSLATVHDLDQKLAEKIKGWLST